jgi:myo-inositol 2-dehydrogenase / D-chiro-inositol 1-dehydrogenase
MSEQNKSNELSQQNSPLTRRKFVKNATLSTAAIGLAPLAFPSLASAQAAAGKQKLKVGVVGLGGRGSGAVIDILKADPDTILWAAGDIFESKLKQIPSFEKSFSGRVDTDGGKREFVGFDAFQKVIDSGADIILLTTTPAFRPQHFAAAVAAGKHVFMEKPFALDIPGLKSIVESAKKAQANNQSVLTGLVWRYSTHLMEMHKRIQDGAIGDILSTSSMYCAAGRPNKMPDMKFKPPTMSDMEWAQRYWQNFLELGGDGTLEYMIHGIDRLSWAMKDEMPINCFANGGNAVPVVGANAWDHFSIRYEYADGRTADFFGRQIPRTYAAGSDNITGTKGRAFCDGSSASIIVDGKTIWQAKGGLGYVEEHKIFTDHIRKGKVLNDVIGKFEISHAITIMGREAAYTGQLITDKQLMASTTSLINTVGLDFNTPFTPRPVAEPGKTKFS